MPKNKSAIGVLKIQGVNCEYYATAKAFNLSWVILNSNGVAQLRKGSTPFCINLGKGSKYTDDEKKRLQAGLKGCDSPPPEAVKAFSDLKKQCASSIGIPLKQLGGDCQCWDGKYVFNRANPGATTLEQCLGPGKNPLRSCYSIHAVGRAQDIINTIVGGITGSYYYFDYRDPITANSIAYKSWLFFAQNAHLYKINGIANEWWHWQYYGKTTTSTNLKPDEQQNNESTTNSEQDISGSNQETTDQNEITWSNFATWYSNYQKLQGTEAELLKINSPSSSKESKVVTEDPEIKSVSKPKIKQDKMIFDQLKQ